jgi:hypothetical protein
VRRVAGGIALAALGGLAGCVLYLAGGPLLDNDVWWHLAHGRAYLESGPWLATDPCLGTAERGPIPHQWLFAVVARGVERAAGLPGLRWFHALAAIGIGWLAFAAFRREAGGGDPDVRGDRDRSWAAPAALATAMFLALAWYRLVQLRPDLLTLAGALLLQRWLFAPALPSGRQIAFAALLVAVWANVHAAFLVGPLLIGAALAGALARCAIARRIGGDAANEDRRAKRLATALGASLAASLLNPRGIAQHLAYLESSRAGAIRMVADEWARFDPFAHTNLAPAVSTLAWLCADVVIAGFLAWLAIAGVRFLRRPAPERLDDVDPVRAALGVAALVAMVSAIRFLFLGVFPLLCLLHAGRRCGWGGAARERVVVAACAAATLAIALAFPVAGGFREVAVHLPRDARTWLVEAHTGHRFFEDGVRFLEATGITGQLFHDYALGGYLCHRLGPRLRTFVDGSMNYPDDIAVDYQSLIGSRGSAPGEGLSAGLDRREVDVYFGFGVPVGGAAPYTSAALEGHPDWLRVSRSWRHGIYLRANDANRENLARIAAWYAGQGVAFDPQRGFDPGLALREHRAWADAWGVLPDGWSALPDRLSRAAPHERAPLLETLGLGYALAGAYPEQLANDRLARELQPAAAAPRRRLVYGLLRLNRPGQALREARALVALDPRAPRSQRFLDGAQRAARATSPDARIAAIDALPLLTSRQPLRQ